MLNPILYETKMKIMNNSSSAETGKDKSCIIWYDVILDQDKTKYLDVNV